MIHFKRMRNKEKARLMTRNWFKILTLKYLYLIANRLQIYLDFFFSLQDLSSNQNFFSKKGSFMCQW